jgi:hypothetical protein
MTNPTYNTRAGLWLGLSIAATVMCCLPLGIPGIVYAAKAMGDESRGDYHLAEENVGKARTWTLVSAGVAILLLVLALCSGAFTNGGS